MSPRRMVAAPCLGIFVGGVILAILAGRREVDFDDWALGDSRESIRARSHVLVHTATDLIARRDASTRTHRTLLWMGNSKLHTINQYAEGDTVAPELLARALACKDTTVVACTQPNVNFQEQLILLHSFVAQRSLDGLILAAVFDDTRETGVRADIARALDEQETRDRLEQTAIGRFVLQEAAPGIDPDLAGVAGTGQEACEAALSGWMNRHWTLWKRRPQLRGQLLTGFHRLRNQVLGITPSSKRRVIPGRYRNNLAALAAMLDATQNVPVLLYVAPLRSDVAPPYDVREYGAFKRAVEELANRFPRCHFINLEGLVPGEYWGTKASTDLDAESEYDYMHFQAGGHRLLASAVEHLVREHVLSSTR